MKTNVPAGKYVVAVSGGVDSVVLLDLLARQDEAPLTSYLVDEPVSTSEPEHLQLVVAHFDHGIRQDSADDRRHVAMLAKKYRLPFVYDSGNLGPDASEADARTARYAFLARAQQASGALGLITAHHQDDVLETAIINLLRGTGRKGLSSLTSNETVIRPLLEVPKSEIIKYAMQHELQWREDSTNLNTDYLRNHIRHDLLKSWSDMDKQRLLDIARHMRAVNHELDEILAADTSGNLNREWFVLLPHNVAREVMATWLRRHSVRYFDRGTLERLTVAAKVSEPGKAIDIVKGHSMYVHKRHLALMRSER